MFDNTLQFILVGFLYPLWLLAGLMDYLCHRRTDIETTSGAHESWFHVAQFATLGVALMAVTWLRVTPPVLVLVAALVIAHTSLAFKDASYTDSRRYISPFEQHVHGYLDVIPVVAVCLIAALNWDDVSSGQWSCSLKETPLAPARAAALVGSYCLLAGIPIFEELFRTLRRQRRKATRARGLIEQR